MRHTFILSNGKVVKTARWMESPTLRPGYWWTSVSKMGSGKSVWREVAN